MPTDETATNRIIVKAEALASGFRLDDRYEIIGRLGDGLMSIVYKARHLQLNREVALKILHEHLADDPEAIQRFQQEAAAISALEHPNIVKVYGSGVWQSRPYISTEFVDGISLANMLEVDHHLPKEQAVPIFLQILEGLAHAHSRGIIHRDLRPSNIMLTEGVKTVKIVDFGIAKVLPESGKQFQALTQTGQLFGTLMYMSPERCMGFPATVKSDLYSMGCLMYETIAGIPPAKGATDAALIDQQVKKTPQKLPLLNDDLGNVIFWCLLKDPDRRPQSAADLKSALLQPHQFRFPKSGRPLILRTVTIAASVVAVVGAAMVMMGIRPVAPPSSPLTEHVLRSEVDDYLDRANKLCEEGKFDEAASVFKALIDRLNLSAKTDTRLAVIEPLLHARLKLSNVLLRQQKFEQADWQVMQILSVFDRHPSLKQSSEVGLAYAEGLRLKGDLAVQQGKNKEGLEWGLKSLDYMKSAPQEVQRWGEASSLQWLADCYLNEGDFSESISFAKQTIQYADDHHGTANGDFLWPKKRAELCLARAYLMQAIAATDKSTRNRHEADAIRIIDQTASTDPDLDYAPLTSNQLALVQVAVALAKTQTDAGQGKKAVQLLSSVDEMQTRTKLPSENESVKEALAKARSGLTGTKTVGSRNN